ncbi:hypothetical protein E2493_05320 [Sphingomonas parva]|uniref:DUF1311 domain-containing protein n=1 Tax=Sphingomonas parva TaxID=2555898 RepID=A0A4Y8ZTB9_9SPHN|nr:hypothetical protein [Sphingomonas parva]TFI59263.1 hypothetical protein E2493_05320 [Sphingomonas parva]
MSRFVRSALSIALASSLVLLGACDWMRPKKAPGEKSEKQLAAEEQEALRKTCASEATYDRLKALVFDQAARIRNRDARLLDPIAAGSVVRMEDPVVKSRDETLGVTVCTGRFILELPPGTENAFDGMRRVSADVEYSAQAAADGSGLVYQMDGAEPVVYRLAIFDLARPSPVELPQPSAPPAAPPEVASVPAKGPAPAVPPAPETRRPEEPAQPASGPSFNCRYGRSNSERMVCGSPALAAKDRQMASIYYAAMARVDPAARAHLRRSRDWFLQRRERCGSEECVAAAYNARIAEIRSIAEGR